MLSNYPKILQLYHRDVAAMKGKLLGDLPDIGPLMMIMGGFIK